MIWLPISFCEFKVKLYVSMFAVFMQKKTPFNGTTGHWQKDHILIVLTFYIGTRSVNYNAVSLIHSLGTIFYYFCHQCSYISKFSWDIL